MKRIVCLLSGVFFTLTLLFSAAVHAGSCGIKQDVNDDGKMGMEEAVDALQVVAGIKSSNPNITLEKAVCALQTAVGMPTEYTEITVKHFEGIWEGKGKFENDKWTGTVTLDLSAVGDGLSGTITLGEIPASEIAGTIMKTAFSFYLPPFDPECTDWDVTATSSLYDSLKALHFRASGTFCGGEPDTLSATLNKKE